MSKLGQSRRLVSQDDASMIARPDVPRSTFTGSFARKFTFDAGFLIPFHVEECYPGDHFRYRFTPFVRTSTPLFPIMDSQRIDIHVFFTPSRLVWTNFVKMMGEQTNPADSIAFTTPKVVSTGNGFGIGSTGDYMGLPTVGQAAAPLSVNALPFRMYNLIYNTWYRDENLINSRPQPAGAGPDLELDFALRRRAKSHDYFTACLPWPQKFTSPVMQFPVAGIGSQGLLGVGGAATVYETGDAATLGSTNYANQHSTSDLDAFRIQMDAAGLYPQIFAEADVNAFRQAMQVQVFLERLARGGTRYTEVTESIFGVKNPDARLQRPEYIGGGSTPLQFTPIAQTAPTTSGSALGLGNLGGAGTAVGNNSASYACTEHGFILAIMSVKSELSYSQGIHPMWDRDNLYDYYNPAFAGLGEQAVLRREIFATGVAANDDVVFGYQERYHELRTHWSTLAGLFRPTSAGNIDEWHLSQQLATPVLGSTFIEDTPPMTRVLAAGGAANGMQYLADVHIECSMTRPVPTYGTPVGLGRF